MFAFGEFFGCIFRLEFSLLLAREPTHKSPWSCLHDLSDLFYFMHPPTLAKLESGADSHILGSKVCSCETIEVIESSNSDWCRCPALAPRGNSIQMLQQIESGAKKGLKSFLSLWNDLERKTLQQNEGSWGRAILITKISSDYSHFLYEPFCDQWSPIMCLGQVDAASTCVCGHLKLFQWN